jgi:hypothetical protein
VEVVGEGRSITAAANGVFRDVLANENSFHVYRVDE